MDVQLLHAKAFLSTGRIGIFKPHMFWCEMDVFTELFWQISGKIIHQLNTKGSIKGSPEDCPPFICLCSGTSKLGFLDEMYELSLHPQSSKWTTINHLGGVMQIGKKSFGGLQKKKTFGESPKRKKSVRGNPHHTPPTR